MRSCAPVARAMMKRMSQMGAHIEFSQVGVAFEGFDACENLTFGIAPGESVALIGPSGCGKSTTLHVMAGLIAPTTGTARVNGEILAKPRHETAFIPQDLGLFPWKTVLQNAMLPLTLRHVPKREAERRARSALEQVGLTGRDRAWPRELSGGQRQRLALARALATDADLLLMDEPLSAVDALLRESLQDVLLELWKMRGHTQLFVTHSIEEAVYLGKRILVFSDHPGTIAADIANPHAGEPGWRDAVAFSEKCHEIRRFLAERGSSDSTAGAGAGEAASAAPSAAPSAALSAAPALSTDAPSVTGEALASRSGAEGGGVR